MAATSLIEPLPESQRHAADQRDDIEHAEVAAILSLLPDGHPARREYSAAQTSDTLGLLKLIQARMDLVCLLIDAHIARKNRIFQLRNRNRIPTTRLE